MNNTYLCHHGIKGQKWGIRRFQNEDGSLTDEGKKKYGTVQNLKKAQTRKRNIAIGVGAAAAVAATAYYAKSRKDSLKYKQYAKEAATNKAFGADWYNRAVKLRGLPKSQEQALNYATEYAQKYISNVKRMDSISSNTTRLGKSFINSFIRYNS